VAQWIAESVPSLIPQTSRGGPEPTDDVVVLAEDSEVSAEIVASDSTAYWVDRGFSNGDSIQAVPLLGGIQTTVYASPGEGTSTIPSLALDSSYLYWAESPLADQQMSLVKRIPLGGGRIEPVLASRGRIQQIFVDPPFLYSVEERSVRATRLSDGSQTTLQTETQALSTEGCAMAADQGVAFWLDATLTSSNGIMAASGPGFWPASLARRDAAISAMRAAGESLYWIERGSSSEGGSLFVMDTAGGVPARVFESIRMSTSVSYGHALLAADEDGVYWMVDPTGPLNDGAVYQGARGLEPRVLVSGVGRPGGVAVSGPRVVFTDMGAGCVVSASK
jgi:hypothetical protein